MIDKIEEDLGLNHSLEYLEEIRPIIGFWSIEKQAEYADIVCIKYGNDAYFLDTQFTSNKEINDYVDELRYTNSTGVGNIAYIAILHKDNELGLKLIEALKRYKDYLEANGGYKHEEYCWPEIEGEEQILEGYGEDISFENIAEEDVRKMNFTQRIDIINNLNNSGQILNNIPLLDTVASIAFSDMDIKIISQKFPKSYTALRELLNSELDETERLG